MSVVDLNGDSPKRYMVKKRIALLIKEFVEEMDLGVDGAAKQLGMDAKALEKILEGDVRESSPDDLMRVFLHLAKG